MTQQTPTFETRRLGYAEKREATQRHSKAKQSKGTATKSLDKQRQGKDAHGKDSKGEAKHIAVMQQLNTKGAVKHQPRKIKKL